MGRRDLEATGTEVHLHVIVHDDGHGTANQRHDYALAFQPAVTLVVGVDADGGITKNSLGTCCGDDDVFILALHVVAQMEQMALLLLINHLFVTEGCQSLGIPIDHPHAAINPTLLIERVEHLDHRFRQLLVHREGSALPVAAGAERTQLFEDDATVFMGPVPCMLQEFLTAQILLFDTLIGQLGHYLGLGADGRMVRTRYPASIFAHHARTTHQDILDRVVQHMSHMQHTGHIRRRNNYRIRLPFVGLRMEQSMFHPVGIPFVLYFRGIIFSR